jgi:hypothetical protein
MKQRTSKWLLVPLCAAFLTTACGDDGGGDDGASSGSTGAATSDPTMDPTMDPTTDPGSTSADPSGSSGAADSSGGADESTGGGAAACETDICATYGAAVPAVSEAIVMQAAADPLFMDDFAPLVAAGDEAVQAFIDSLAAFISDAYGCTEGAYTGPSMEAAHTGLDITQEEYDAFIGLIVGVLTEAGVPESDITACFAPPLVDPDFVATIVGL